MLKVLLGLTVASALLLTSCSNSDVAISPISPTPQSSPEIGEPDSQETAEPMEPGKANSKSESKASEKPTKVKKTEDLDEPLVPGSYLTLQEFEGSGDRFKDADVVFFFNANWCSTCKIARDNIESNLNAIPTGLAIVVVDFDREIELRKKYGVTIQHTFVQIDGNGNQLAKWSGSVTAEEIAKRTV
jgi:thioredoxin 1